MKTFVVIVTFNGMQYIERCLDALSKSTLDHSVIIIDNASKDGTVAFLKKNYTEIILLEQKENLGFGKANNVGLSYALRNDCDYVFLLNQDAYVEPGTLKTLLNVAATNKDYGIISPIHLNGKGNYLDESFLYYIKQAEGESFLSDIIIGKEKKLIYSLRMINAAAWLLPVNTLNVVGGFSPQFFLYGEDDNYCQRVLFHGLKVGFSPEAYILHDSINLYSKEFKSGTKEYYRKFLNRIKIKYGNVNTSQLKNLGNLKFFYFKKAFFSIMKLDIKRAKIYWTQSKLLGNIKLENNVQLERKPQRTYLDI